jgi:hypothetical protein
MATRAFGATVTGRVSLLPRHELEALPNDERFAAEALERHLWLRHHRPALTGRDDPPLEVLEDGTGVGVFLTIAYVQTLLRQVGSPKTGEDYAARIINEILPRLGLLAATPYVKKPGVRRAHPGVQRQSGGRHAQPGQVSSYWWRIFRLPTLSRLVAPRCGAYSSGAPLTRPRVSASLVGLLECQGLLGRWRRASEFGRGSVQEAFWATGPP